MDKVKLRQALGSNKFKFNSVHVYRHVNLNLFINKPKIHPIRNVNSGLYKPRFTYQGRYACLWQR